MTSNVGVELIKRESGLGFATPRDKTKTLQQGYEAMKVKVMTEVKKLFRPEFINRLDEIIVFHELTEEQLRSIVDLMVQDLEHRLAEHKVGIELTGKAKTWLAKEGYDPVYGARPLRRVIQRYVESPLSVQILRGNFGAGAHILVDVDEDKLVFQTEETQAGTEPVLESASVEAVDVEDAEA